MIPYAVDVVLRPEIDADLVRARDLNGVQFARSVVVLEAIGGTNRVGRAGRAQVPSVLFSVELRTITPRMGVLNVSVA